MSHVPEHAAFTGESVAKVGPHFVEGWGERQLMATSRYTVGLVFLTACVPLSEYDGLENRRLTLASLVNMLERTFAFPFSEHSVESRMLYATLCGCLSVKSVGFPGSSSPSQG